MKKIIRLFMLLVVLSFCICGCNSSISATVADVEKNDILEPVNCKELLKNWFEEGYQPPIDQIVTLNDSKEVGDYKITLCEMLSNNMGSYILIKIETKDGSKLKTGDISKAPENFRGGLTDIDFEHWLNRIGEQGTVFSSDMFCEKIIDESDSASYYLIEGFYTTELTMLDDKSSGVNLSINKITLYEPYMGSVTEKETVISSKNIAFEINNEITNNYYTFVTDKGEIGYLYNNAFITEFIYDINGLPPSIHWEIEYEGEKIVGNYDGSYILYNGRTIYLKWIRKYLDMDKVKKITINDKEYKRIKD